MFKQWKEAWLKSQEETLKKEFAARLSSIKEQYEIQIRHMESLYKQKQDDVAYESKRVEDSKLALAKCNGDLRQQIKLIEAKASPDQVWVSAFTSGFNTAYQSMSAFLQKDVEVKRDLIRESAFNEAIGHLEPTIHKRLEDAGKVELRPVSDILAKKEDFEARVSTAKTELERTKYQSYVKAFEWVLNHVDGNKIRQD
jgi:hypothetical protein